MSSLLPNLLRLGHLNLLNFSLGCVDVGGQKGLCKVTSEYDNEEEEQKEKKEKRP